MRRVIITVLLLLIPVLLLAQGWRASVNNQEIFYGAAARPLTTNTATLGTAGANWLTVFARDVTLGAAGLLTAPTINATTAYQANGAAGVSGTCDTPTFTIGLVTTCGGAGGSVDGTYIVTSNFVTDGASVNLQNITGLAWTFPANTALNIPFRCSFWYSQATAAAADSFGVQDVTIAMTNGAFGGSMETALGTTAYGDVVALASTTATAIVTGTPSATATVFNAYMDGLIEQPSNASTSVFNVMVKTVTAADIITIYRGSYCKVG